MGPQLFILTANRCELLCRCLNEAVRSCSSDTRICVIDDSTVVGQRENVRIIQELGLEKRVSHIDAPETLAGFARHIPNSHWTRRSRKDDIAPLRTLALLLQADCPASFTLLIDDDVMHFDVAEVARYLDVKHGESEEFVAGAYLGGVDENDSITRLVNSLKAMSAQPAGSEIDVARLVLRSPVPVEDQPLYASGGFLAFRLRSSRLIPFPAGYNEDWQWCILQRLCLGTPISRLPMVVTHAPAAIRSPSVQRLLFELTGDFILEVLEKTLRSNPRACDVRDLPIPSPDTVRQADPLRRIDAARLLVSKAPDARATQVRHVVAALCGSLLDPGLSILETLDWTNVYENWHRHYSLAVAGFTLTAASSQSWRRLVTDAAD